MTGIGIGMRTGIEAEATSLLTAEEKSGAGGGGKVEDVSSPRLNGDEEGRYLHTEYGNFPKGSSQLCSGTLDALGWILSCCGTGTVVEVVPSYMYFVCMNSQ